MRICVNCYCCKMHCQCNYPEWRDRVNYCCEKCEVVDSRIAELEAQLAHERERNANNVANAELQIAELRAEITRLRSGGCAREQNTTQYCGAMQELVSRLTKLAEEWRTDETWDKTIDETLRHCAKRLTVAIGGKERQ